STPEGVPIGLENDAAYFGESLAEAIAGVLAVPPSVAAATAIDAWRAATLACLRQAADLTLISVWSPTFLLELVRHLDRPPAELWPRLDTISCWTSGSSSLFAADLRALFPDCHIQGKGLLATEGAVTLPLANYEYPVLAIESGFFEFLDDSGVARPAHELERGAEYRVLMTTHSGLYRYDLGDRVAMRGWAQETPMLEFLGRAGLTSDLCGEKLTEDFVIPRLPRGFAMLAPSLDGGPHYALFVDAEASSAGVDDALGDNPQYRYARALGQLGPVRVHMVARGMERYTAHELARGRRLGDIKPPALSGDTGWERVFLD
ncbi:MAG: hypothetical protein ACRD96_14565, partial [Bryobacteraceae bacterium]